MKNKEQERIIRYLTRRYDSMSEKSIKIEFNSIKKRLLASKNWEADIIDTIINSLLFEENWSLAKICAYLDVLDLDDRT